jgi:hypothetical protein
MTESRKQRVKYVGNSPRVSVPLPDGSEASCDNGKSIAVAPDVAKSLLRQGGWEKGDGVKATEDEKGTD